MRTAIYPLLLAAFAVCAIAQDGAVPKPDAKPAPAAVPPAEKEAGGARSELPTAGPGMRLSSLPSRYQFLLMEAMRRFQLRDFKGATDYIERADEVLPPTAWSLNVRGAIAIEQHDFERGFRLCSDALKLDPGFFPAKFNICEIPFLQGKYAEARGLWMKIYNTVKAGDSISELLTYRIYLTYLLENDFDRAKDWLEKLPFPSQTPAYQYAHAAWSRQKGDLAKWDDWIRSAAYIWPETKRGEFADVLIQLGWIKRE
jgi:tetratricopeptide (TPR) repeat protein